MGAIRTATVTVDLSIEGRGPRPTQGWGADYIADVTGRLSQTDSEYNVDVKITGEDGAEETKTFAGKVWRAEESGWLAMVFTSMAPGQPWRTKSLTAALAKIGNHHLLLQAIKETRGE